VSGKQITAVAPWAVDTPAWGRRLAASVLGALVLALAIPSAGCDLSFTCNEACFGTISCEGHALDECSSHDGCSVGGSCRCARSSCAAATASDCNSQRTELECNLTSAPCAWRPRCVGFESCGDLYDDADSCSANSECAWEHGCA